MVRKPMATGGATAPAAGWRRLAARLLRHRFARFSFVGGVGFAIEAIMLTYLATVPAIGSLKGRLISFPVAVAATWWLNRTLTFQSRNNAQRESIRYFLVQILGAFTNFILFLALVSGFPALRPIPVIPLFIGAVAGLLVNFTLSKIYVFAQHEKNR